jgi:ABC-type branched-subunit amino acid transport system ATPase component
MTATDQPPALPLAVPPEAEAEDRAGLARLLLAASSSEPEGRGWGRITGGGPLLPLVIMFGLLFLVSVEQATAVWLAPELTAYFNLNSLGIQVLRVITVQFGLFLTAPLAFRADHNDRARILLTGACLFAVFSVGSALSPPVWWVFLILRVGSTIGLATVLSTSVALIADLYNIAHRPKVYAVHGAAVGLGIAAGIVLAVQVGMRVSWRLPFVLLAVPTVALVYAGRHLIDPGRGRYERAAMGLTGEALALEEEPPTFEEGRRMVQRVESLRRLFFAMPFLAVSLVGFGHLADLFYEREFHLDVAERAPLELIANLGQLLGIMVAYLAGARVVRRDPARFIRLILVVSLGAALFVVLFAVARDTQTALIARVGLSACLAAVMPAIFATLSLAVPSRARSTGFSVAVLYLLPGLLLILVAEFIGDAWGMRWGVVAMAPVLLLGGYLASTVHRVLDRDIRNVWTATATRSELRAARQRGEIKQLLVRGLDVHYGDVQVLFGVDFEVSEGEIVALLGTNGAGKSTLLRAITGLVPATRGAIVFDGRDITASPAHETAAQGIAMVPGGMGVFPSLTVSENLKVAHWGTSTGARASDALTLEEGTERVVTTFPILRDRLGDPAANLSGGQQQMLALGMAFLSRPKLLVIDELSLGLAPVVIEQLLAIVRVIAEQGTTVILVEQSVNVALTLAETAYFMEKGEIRFHGPTADLLDRPDVLRSVFLEGAATHLSANGDGDDAVTAPVSSGEEERPVDTTQAPAIELVDLSVRFGGIRAVDNVSLSVVPGEILGIIGPNGAGKTTLFDLISGFTAADSGRVVLGDRDITRRGPDGRARQGLGRSFQDARLFPALTVEETIKVALERFVDAKDPFNAMLRLPIQQKTEVELQAWVDELIELLGLGAFRAKFVRELSTGSRRIVDLACVLAHRPSVVLLDEPSSGIAQRETEALAPLITRIRDALGASLLLIEHDMPLVSSVSDRLVALDQGRVVVDGPAAVVLNHPDVVASYLGDREDVIARSGQRAG